MKNNRYYLPAVAFAVGASVMAIEMTASRVLAPHFGASFFVWTALIVTVLLSMSLGYWFGGRFAARLGDDREPLGFLLVGAAAMLLVGLWASYGLSGGVSLVLVAMNSSLGALFVGALLMTFILFSLPVFVLAAAGPLILRYWSTESNDVGLTAGRYFALSTVGSVIGTVLPSLLLVPLFGVRWTFMLVAAVLAALGLPVLRRQVQLAAGLVVLAGLAMVYLSGGSNPPEVIYEEESPYQLIRVEQRHDANWLIFNEGSGIQSVYFPDRERTRMYFDHLASVPLLVDDGRDQLRTAVLGLAGGTLVRQYLATYPERLEPEIVGVEVDPSVVQVARRFFALDDLPIQVEVEDGRTFLAAAADPFDVIIVDAYSTQMYIPSHMASREFFELVRDRLTAGGLTAMNVNATSADSELLRAIVNTAASVFPHVYVTKAGNTWNYLVVAAKRPLDYGAAAARLPEDYADLAPSLLAVEPAQYDSQAMLLTDDRAPIELMTDSMIIADAVRQMR